MLLETVDVGYWLLMPVLSCICLAVAILVASSSGGDGQRCCRRKRFQDDVSCVEDGQKCSSGGNGGSSEDDPTKKAVEGDNPDDDDVFLADIVTPMRSFSECHLHPYLYEPSHGEKSNKKAIIVVRSFERNRNVVNTLTEQVHHLNFPVASTGQLLSTSVELKGSATAHAISLHGDQSPAPAEDQMQSDLSTSPRGTYENCLGCRREACNSAMHDGIYDDAIECCIHASEGSSVRTYAELRSSSTEFPSGTTTVASYTRLRNPDTDSSDLNGSTTSDYRTLLPNGDENAYTCSLSDSNLYNYTLSGDSNTKSDTPQPPADGGIAVRPTIAVLRSCDRRRSEVESGHYSTLDDTHDCNGTMSGIYDIIEDPKYQTVCTTTPAATKQEHELKTKDKAEMEAAKRKTMIHAPIGETQLTKASTNEVY